MSAKVVIQQNTIPSNAHCAFCQQPIRLAVGPVAVEADFWGALCAACVERHAPVLGAMLTKWTEHNALALEREARLGSRCEQAELTDAETLRQARDLFHLAR